MLQLKADHRRYYDNYRNDATTKSVNLNYNNNTDI